MLYDLQDLTCLPQTCSKGKVLDGRMENYMNLPPRTVVLLNSNMECQISSLEDHSLKHTSGISDTSGN